MSFLPNDYQAPKTSSGYYMRLVEGENRIRIMSKPIFGWEDWVDKKPVRFTMDKKPLKSFDHKKPVKHFWAFIVFNYQEEQIQIMQITQGTIRKSIESLCNDKDWGSPYAYDIKIMKKGEGIETEYSVNPVPHKAIEPYVVVCFNERKCNIEALFDGADPFAIEGDKYTKRATVEDTVIEPDLKIVDIKAPKITEEQATNIKALIAECSDEFSANIHDFMKKQGIDTYKDFTKETYDKVLKRALEERAKTYSKKVDKAIEGAKK